MVKLKQFNDFVFTTLFTTFEKGCTQSSHTCVWQNSDQTAQKNEIWFSERDRHACASVKERCVYVCVTEMCVCVRVNENESV